MSYYSVKMNWYESGSGLVAPVDVYDPTEKTMVLIDPVVTIGVGEAGNFEFTVPRNHVFYEQFRAYECSIAVFEEEDCIFFGRLLPPAVDTFGQKKFHAEGALAFLNDCILPQRDMGDQITVAEYIEQILDYYNQYASARPDREFVFNDLLSTDLANITIYDPQPWNYQSAKDIIVNYLYQYCGGYFYIEFTDFDELEFKWRYNLTEQNNQVIQRGVNLLDFVRNGNEFYTAAIAKGGTDLDGNQVGMVAPVYDTLNAPRFGVICKCLEYPSVTVVDALEAYCENFLEEQQYDGCTFDANAADQHPLTSTFNKYSIGQLVNLKIEELGVNVTIPITKIVYKLHTALKEVTVGITDARIKAISTAFAKSEAKMDEMGKEMECCSEDKQDKEINGYVIDIDDEGNISAVKVPKRIEFTRKITMFRVGSVLNYSLYEITAYYSDNTSEVVTSSCTFNIVDGYVFKQYANPRVLIANYTHSSGKKLSAQTTLKLVSAPEEEQTKVKSIATIEETVYVALLYLGGEWAEHLPEILEHLAEEDLQSGELSHAIADYNDKACNLWVVGEKTYNQSEDRWYYRVHIGVSIYVDIEVGDTIPKTSRRVYWSNGGYKYKTVTCDSATLCGPDYSWYAPEYKDRAFYFGSCNLTVE